MPYEKSPCNSELQRLSVERLCDTKPPRTCITNDTAKQYGIDLCDLFSLAADLLSCMGSISIDGDNYDYEVISDFWYDSCSNSVIITSPYLHELLLSIMYYGEALVCDVIKEVEEIIVDGDY